MLIFDALLFNVLYGDLSPATEGSARINAKGREKKERRVIRTKKRKERGAEGETLNPIEATEALIENEE